MRYNFSLLASSTQVWDYCAFYGQYQKYMFILLKNLNTVLHFLNMLFITFTRKQCRSKHVKLVAILFNNTQGCIIDYALRRKEFDVPIYYLGSQPRYLLRRGEEHSGELLQHAPLRSLLRAAPNRYRQFWQMCVSKPQCTNYVVGAVCAHWSVRWS